MPYYGDGAPYYYGGGGGSPFSNHSSLMTSVGRYYSPIAARYSPHLSTISESPSPFGHRRRHVSTTGASPSGTAAFGRPRRTIDTADIDVTKPPRNYTQDTHHNQTNNRHRLRRDRPTIKIRSQALKDNPALREYNEKHEKTVGELLVEKFLIKDKQPAAERRMRLYHQASLLRLPEEEPVKGKEEEEEEDLLAAMRRRVTRRMTRRRSSADVVPMNPEQIEREAALLAAQAEALDSLVAEEQAEIEVEVRRGTFAKRQAMRCLAVDVSETEDEGDEPTAPRKRKHQRKRSSMERREVDSDEEEEDDDQVILEIPESVIEEEEEEGDFEWDDRVKCDDVGAIVPPGKDEVIIKINDVVAAQGALGPRVEEARRGLLPRKLSLEIIDEKIQETRKEIKDLICKEKRFPELKRREKMLKLDGNDRADRGKAMEVGEVVPRFKIEACNSVGDFSTLYVKAANAEPARKVESHRESVRLPAPPSFLQHQEVGESRGDVVETTEEIVLPMRKPYVLDAARNSVYLALKPSQKDRRAIVDESELDRRGSIVIDETRKESVAKCTEDRSKIESGADTVRVVGEKGEAGSVGAPVAAISAGIGGKEEFVAWWDESPAAKVEDKSAPAALSKSLEKSSAAEAVVAGSDSKSAAKREVGESVLKPVGDKGRDKSKSPAKETAATREAISAVEKVRDKVAVVTEAKKEVKDKSELKSEREKPVDKKLELKACTDIKIAGGEKSVVKKVEPEEKQVKSLVEEKSVDKKVEPKEKVAKGLTDKSESKLKPTDKKAVKGSPDNKIVVEEKSADNKVQPKEKVTKGLTDNTTVVEEKPADKKVEPKEKTAKALTDNKIVEVEKLVDKKTELKEKAAKSLTDIKIAGEEKPIDKKVEPKEKEAKGLTDIKIVVEEKPIDKKVEPKEKDAKVKIVVEEKPIDKKVEPKEKAAKSLTDKKTEAKEKPTDKKPDSKEKVPESKVDEKKDKPKAKPAGDRDKPKSPAAKDKSLSAPSRSEKKPRSESPRFERPLPDIPEETSQITSPTEPKAPPNDTGSPFARTTEEPPITGFAKRDRRKIDAAAIMKIEKKILEDSDSPHQIRSGAIPDNHAPETMQQPEPEIDFWNEIGSPRSVRLSRKPQSHLDSEPRRSLELDLSAPPNDEEPRCNGTSRRRGSTDEQLSETERTSTVKKISKWTNHDNLSSLNDADATPLASKEASPLVSAASSTTKKRIVKKKKPASAASSTKKSSEKVSTKKGTKKGSKAGSKAGLKAPMSAAGSPRNSPSQRPADLNKLFYTTPAILLTATPRDLRKVRRAKVKRKKPSTRTPSLSSDSTGSTRSTADTSNEEGSNCEEDAEHKRLASTRSNDSGFDGSPRLSTPSQSSENQRSNADSDHFHHSGRITPPATNLPRFKKYEVTDFNFLKVLGKGSFGKVLLAELRGTECVYAVKCLKKDVVLEDDDVECTLIERKVLTLATRHPYLCHLFCTFQTESHLFFVMEYLNGGDLMFHIQKSGRFSEARARFYAAEIWSGLIFLHKKGIVYRDLKLDNVLLDFEGHIRIADFGMCKLQIFLDRTADTFCGTPDYMAPEIIKGLKYNQAVDWWSFGVLLYEMLTGQSPFSGCDEDELFWSICNERPFIPRYLCQSATELLVCLLEKDSGKRIPGHEIACHSFFNSIAWDKLERRTLEPPFKPAVEHTLDTRYFDTAFTTERPRLTQVPEQILTSMDQTVFRGFSYTNPNATD
ncbi:LOW QUALITY PROTEIN: microtubule-associated protein futsch-like [Copidosoma floridanum]|uniref:LOW QUALITY PROTEIN: microtubule-associated protein futsch-like n=1 Tax=Copidosoma floridanum TaxID=29053 RepID=UPI0006C9A8B5|nr:LOW QUALITY PROTEIN: microtubule-associated protein futsch-like [Copidosoma floridanum]